MIESKNSNYSVNSNVYGSFGWRTHTIFDPNDTADHFIRPYVLPSFGDLPLFLALGHLGMPGICAYFGFLDNCEPKEGEIVVVSGAAGAVGSIVGQIARVKGCKVIGIAGSDDKCNWITDDVGFDHAINYKTENVAEALRKCAPQGVDCYFDNVGGDLSSIVVAQMHEFGRISVCGHISSYNLPISECPRAPILQPAFVFKQLTMRGFNFTRYLSQWLMVRWHCTNEGND